MRVQISICYDLFVNLNTKNRVTGLQYICIACLFASVLIFLAIFQYQSMRLNGELMLTNGITRITSILFTSRDVESFNEVRLTSDLTTMTESRAVSLITVACILLPISTLFILIWERCRKERLDFQTPLISASLMLILSFVAKGYSAGLF